MYYVHILTTPNRNRKKLVTLVFKSTSVNSLSLNMYSSSWSHSLSLSVSLSLSLSLCLSVSAKSSIIIWRELIQSATWLLSQVNMLGFKRTAAAFSERTEDLKLMKDDAFSLYGKVLVMFP